MGKSVQKKGELTPRVRHEVTPLDELDRLFDRLAEGGFMTPFEWRLPRWAGFRGLEERVPHVDVIERDNEILVRAELPGIHKDDLKVTIADDLLTVEGETHEEKEEEGEYFRSEIRHGTFARTVRLPTTVVSEKANATFEHGVLEITLPKAEVATRRVIKVE
jgi:HSP20 family protein